VEHELVVLSPEKTIVTYRLSGIGSRILAHTLDVLLIAALYMSIAYIAGAVTGLEPGLGTALIVFSGVALPFLYFILFEGLWNGQTIGKKAANLRVRMADGTPVTFGAALGRNLLRPADLLPGFYFVGLLAIFTSPRSQRLGDLVSGTVVVHERRGAPRFSPAPHTAGIHAMESHVGELRGMTIEEYQTLRRLCDRFPELTPTAQSRLLEEVWRPIAAKRGIPIVSNVHPLYLAEATVMRYGREHGLL
jgi:uncharacterized RDD family membrane protein YckC